MIWTILVCLAIPILGLVIIFIRNPAGAFILVAMLLSPLFVNAKPPPMFEADIAGMSNIKNEAGRKITTRLQERFPSGTTEATLKSALLKQGFEPVPPAPVNCVPEGVPARVPYTPCPTIDLSKVLVYHWGRGVCSSTISVRWETNKDQAITKVDGGYDVGCL